MSKDSDYKFSLEYEELKAVGQGQSQLAASLPCNRHKNRYSNILPHDVSRVKLTEIEGVEGSDYINANFIPGVHSAREYIATQGPLPGTVCDFWRMVWEQRAPAIVCLTQCVEKGRTKCDRYWPAEGRVDIYGHLSVTLLSEATHEDWTIRCFQLSQGGEIHETWQCSYTAWPDHGVPSTQNMPRLLTFVCLVRCSLGVPATPIIVHCSAGVGRTGTFIALDLIQQHLQSRSAVDILALVAELRRHRPSMVQTEEQYVFLHGCVLAMWRARHEFIPPLVYENAHVSTDKGDGEKRCTGHRRWQGSPNNT
uniref:protein-tyrosine-phosphatase n=1 Tax=Eptatretus burgeri TaxID=7764 RepID=A0A8C4WS68_EPTBU